MKLVPLRDPKKPRYKAYVGLFSFLAVALVAAFIVSSSLEQGSQTPDESKASTYDYIVCPEDQRPTATPTSIPGATATPTPNPGITCSAGLTMCSGTCVNLSNNVNNCGTCGNICSSINAVRSCISGTCSLVCNTLYADCDNNVSNGCETQLGNNSNCGYCGNVCGQGYFCSSGLCVPVSTNSPTPTATLPSCYSIGTDCLGIDSNSNFFPDHELCCSNYCQEYLDEMDQTRYKCEVAPTLPPP